MAPRAMPSLRWRRDLCHPYGCADTCDIPYGTVRCRTVRCAETCTVPYAPRIVRQEVLESSSHPKLYRTLRYRTVRCAETCAVRDRTVPTVRCAETCAVRDRTVRCAESYAIPYRTLACRTLRRWHRYIPLTGAELARKKAQDEAPLGGL
jgi:hypothetical protein